MSERSNARIDRSVSTAPTHDRVPPAPTTLDVMRRAAAEGSQPLDRDVRNALETRFTHDFGRVRVHSGPHSARAAERLGARAYTLGADIHLGAEAWPLTGRERTALLAHEAAHTAQQGSAFVAPHHGLAVGDPHSAAEREAQHIGESVAATGTRRSPSLAIRDSQRAVAPSAISPVASPVVQRDLTGKHTSTDGDFDLNLKDQSNPGAKSGMSGTIKFKPKASAPDSTSIRLLQVVRVEDLVTGKDYSWTGAEANRNKVMSAADAGTGAQAGFFVDHKAAAASPRSAKTDPAVSPYYRDYWPNAGSSQDGSKKGKTIKEASLWDYPGASQKVKFSFETAAKATDTDYIYATLTWGFTLSDPPKGTISAEHAKANYVQSSTFNAAVAAFDKFYKNPGASTAP